MDILSVKTLIHLILILILGVQTSIEDIKHKLVKNKVLIVFLIIGIALNLFFQAKEFIINYLYNIIFALFIGFFLWYINFWNAGDGKLFFTIVSLFPIQLMYKNITYLYSYNLIVYTFVPVFIVFLIVLVTQITKKDMIWALKEGAKPKIFFHISLAFFSFQWVMQSLNIHFGIKFNLFIGGIALFFIFNALEKSLNLKLINLFYVLSVARFIFDYQRIFTLQFLIRFLIDLMVFIFVVYFLIYLAYFKYGTHVKIPDLKKGMNLSENIIRKKDGTLTVEPTVKISLFMFLHDKTKKEVEIEAKPDGLSKEEIRKIQDWNREGLIDVGEILIQKRVPFAPFQFAGAIIFLIFTLIN